MPWTREQSRRYVVLGWARDTLLVQIEPSYVTLDRRLPGVYALDGPGRLRRLPLSELVAIGPDGRRAIGAHRVGDGPGMAVRLVDLARGRVRTSLPLRFVGRQGDWTAKTAVAVVSVGRRRELVVLRIGSRSLSLVRRLRPGGGSLSRPLFVGGARHVVVHASQPRFAGILSCDLVGARCARAGRTCCRPRAGVGDRQPEPAGVAPRDGRRNAARGGARARGRAR